MRSEIKMQYTPHIMARHNVEGSAFGSVSDLRGPAARIQKDANRFNCEDRALCGLVLGQRHNPVLNVEWQAL
jgi:hypothetical protein